MRRFLPWLGLLLLAGSLVWLVRLPPPVEVARGRKPARPANQRLVVVLDPGHGGVDSGAICGSVAEKDLTLDVARRADLLLRVAGFATVLTRSDDQYVPLAKRAAIANHQRDAIFVSIHFNDGERAAASGVETYFSSRRIEDSGGFLLAWLPFFQTAKAPELAALSETLARSLQENLIEQTAAVDRGTKSADFYVIENVRHPAVLVEGGFLTNHGDAAKLETAGYREQLASAICRGIERYEETVAREQPTLVAARTE